MFLFKKQEKIDYSEARRFVSKLIREVLTEKMHVKDALLKFPQDTADPSIKASWHALCHFEADEELRARNSEYANEQNDYLAMIAEEFEKGNPLPVNIVEEYKKYYDNPLTPHSEGFTGFLAAFENFVNIKK